MAKKKPRQSDRAEITIQLASGEGNQLITLPTVTVPADQAMEFHAGLSRALDFARRKARTKGRKDRGPPKRFAERDKEIIRLEGEGYLSQGQIAQRMGVTLSTVKSVLHRARHGK